MTTNLFSKIILFLTVMTFGYSLQAQQRSCAAHDHLLEQLDNDPKRAVKMQQIEQHTRNVMNNPQNRVTGTITIPVVVHVVYRTSTENISDAQIQTQIDVLNDDFRRLNGDANNTWSQAADSEIEFCLASVDPNGNATSGITRTQTSVNGFGTNDAVKFTSQGGVNAWDTDSYLNIWVCNIGGGILGYAQFPGGNPATDGVVNGYQYFGTTGTATAPFNLGRTMTHEVGHYLNLRHIWGDGNCNADDFVSDTPTSDAPNYGCASGHVSCSSTDMVQNYMDYSDDGCMNLFTQGQKARMRALFDAGGARASLLNSAACGTAPPPGPSCNDGIQNGNETGIDCGGPDCDPCPVACTDNDVTLTIVLDNYPEETSWTLTTDGGVSVAAGGTYGSLPDGSTFMEDFCLADGCYTFTISDSYGDGICCGYGNGSYNLTDGAGNVLASGSNFGSSDATDFCFGGGTAPTCTDGVQNGDETGVDCGGSNCPACPTCNDGIQNGNETGVDCGGPDCAACPTCDDGVQNGNETGVDCGGDCTPCVTPPTCDDGIQNGNETGVDCGGDCAPCDTGGGDDCKVFADDDFEAGWGTWNDGGSDCARSGTSSYANSGSYSIRLRDNTNSSVMTTDVLDMLEIVESTVEFSYYAVSMENGEDFWLQASVDGGSWQTLATWARGTDFENNQRMYESVVITGSFTSDVRFRFRCDASVNNDRVYIDDVTITGCVTSSARQGEEALQLMANDNGNALDLLSDMTVFPNPVSEALNISFNSTDANDVTLMITDFTGKVVMNRQLDNVTGQRQETISVNDLTPGFYFATLITGKTTLTKKFVVAR